MPDFHNVRFPITLGFGASGGPEFNTEITQLSNGAEHRNTPRALPRRRFDAGPGVRSQADLINLQEFFVARKGRLHSFRFLDPFDHKSCGYNETLSATDQTLGIGDGQAIELQLIKTYDNGTLARPVTKPDAESVEIALNGVPLSKSDFSADEVTGLVTFAAPPSIGVIVTAGFKFDCVVRFDTDVLNISFEDFGAGLVPSVPLVELPHA
jgi:uncharacterized protein (TIGR02217 family)